MPFTFNIHISIEPLWLILPLAIVLSLVALYLTSLKVKNYNAFRAQNKIYEILIDGVPSGVLRCLKDDVLTIRYFNSSFLSMIGYTHDEISSVFNNKMINIIYKDDLSDTYKCLYEQLSRGNLFEIRNRLIRKDGSTIWVMCRGQRAFENGQEYLYCVLLNITDTIQNEQKQKIDEERYRIIAESSDSVIFEYNIKEKKVYYTNKFKYKFGREPITANVPEAVINTDFIHTDDLKKFISAYSKLISGSVSGSEELRIKKTNGEYIWCQVRYSTIFDEKGMPIRAVGKIIDIDRQKKETENLIKANQMDSFTGLYNKISSLKLIDKYINENKERKHALFFIDLDNFKAVNDRYGHIFGDTVLLEISSRIKRQFRFSDIVGRIGGDEFIVLLKDFIDEEFITEKAEALCRSIFSVKFDGYDLNISTSVGISVYPEDGINLAELYEKSDMALYAAKSDGKNRYRKYSHELGAKQYLKALTKSAISSGFERMDDVENHTSFLLSISETIHNSLNIDDSVNNILQMMGTRFSADRVYIYEYSLDGTQLSNTYEWCAPDIGSNKAKMQLVREIEASKYLKYFNKDNIFYCQDVSELPAEYHLAMDISDVSTFIQCGLFEGGRFKGFIGFDLCNSSRLWKKEEIETLSYTAKTLSIFLTQKRLEEIVHSSFDRKMEVLENIDIFAYAVETSGYSIIYINSTARKFRGNIGIGNSIFSCICGCSVPCELCEVASLKNIGDSFTCEKKGDNGIVRLTATKVMWKDNTPAILVFCKDCLV